MTGFVLDASVAVTWLFEDRARADCDALQTRVVAERGIAPELWRWEVASVWLKKSRRDGLSAQEIDVIETIFGFFSAFVVLEQAGAQNYRDAIALAQRLRLSAYDAAYLELAIRRDLPLATLDQALRAAATRAGLAVLP